MRIGAVTPALATTLTLRVGKAANCGEVKRQLSATLILISAAALRRPIDPVISDWFYPAAATPSAVIHLRPGILRYRPAQLLRRGHRRAIIGDIDFSLDPAEQLDQSRAVAPIIC